jgi:hypothetical protein
MGKCFLSMERLQEKVNWWMLRGMNVQEQNHCVGLIYMDITLLGEW